MQIKGICNTYNDHPISSGNKLGIGPRPGKAGTAVKYPSAETGARAVAVSSSAGVLTVLENICTHMGCQTGWELSGGYWECPCHGSRFNPDRSALRGPATLPLTSLAFHIESDEIVLD